MLSRASNPEALGFLSGEVSLASKPEELLIAIAHRCRKLIIIQSLQHYQMYQYQSLFLPLSVFPLILKNI
jgi:hypothetical protein